MVKLPVRAAEHKEKSTMASAVRMPTEKVWGGVGQAPYMDPVTEKNAGSTDPLDPVTPRSLAIGYLPITYRRRMLPAILRTLTINRLSTIQQTATTTANFY